jgi:hypothetical protein
MLCMENISRMLEAWGKGWEPGETGMSSAGLGWCGREMRKKGVLWRNKRRFSLIVLTLGVLELSFSSSPKNFRILGTWIQWFLKLTTHMLLCPPKFVCWKLNSQ